MRSLFKVTTFLFLLVFSAGSVYAQQGVPIVFHILEPDNPGDSWHNYTTPTHISQVLCDVNNIYSGKAAMTSGLAGQTNSFSPSDIGDAGIRFVSKVRRYTNLPASGASPCATSFSAYPYDPTAINVYLYDWSIGGVAANGITCPNGGNKSLIFLKLSGFLDGNTLAHELGHYLNLLHLQGDGINGPMWSQPPCSGDPDCCPDTYNPNANSLGVASNCSNYIQDPYNIMNSINTGCRVFLSPQQRARISNSIAQVGNLAFISGYVNSTINLHQALYAGYGIPAFTELFDDPNGQVEIATLPSSCQGTGGISYIDWKLYKPCHGDDKYGFINAGSLNNVANNSIYYFDFGPYIAPQWNCLFYAEFVIHYAGTSATNTVSMYVNTQGYDPQTCDCSYIEDPDMKPLPTSVGQKLVSDIKYVYPNPANSKIYLKNYSTVKHVSIYTMTGAKVLDVDDVKEVIDVSALGSGIYIVEITDISNNITNEQLSIN